MRILAAQTDSRQPQTIPLAGGVENRCTADTLARERCRNPILHVPTPGEHVDTLVCLVHGGRW